MIRAMRRTGLAAAALGLLIGSAGQAQAGLLYSATPDYHQNSFRSTTAAGQEQESSPFVISGTATVTGINWWGDYFNNSKGADSFTLRFYAGAGGPDPTAVAEVAAASLTRTDLGFTGLRGDEEYSYSATLSTPFVATGGTQYYVAILNSNDNWLWQLDGSGTHYIRTAGEGTPWTKSSFLQQDAFQLTDNVVATPEPSTIVSAGTAGLMLLGYGWRRRKARA